MSSAEVVSLNEYELDKFVVSCYIMPVVIGESRMKNVFSELSHVLLLFVSAVPEFAEINSFYSADRILTNRAFSGNDIIILNSRQRMPYRSKNQSCRN